jgi:membrane-bound lytic murein transglycosylase D
MIYYLSDKLFFRVKLMLTALFFIIFCVTYVVVKTLVYPPSSNAIAYNNNNFNVLGLNIPSDLHFCGEPVPSNNYGIRNALEKEFFTSAYWKTSSLIFFNKAQRWFPYIEPILKREGVPDDFKYLSLIESHLSNVTSPAGAVGFWQLVPFSARQYGLEVNDYVDERYHVEKATVAACKHLKDAYDNFNNWTLAAAAYNRGIGGIRNALRSQKADSYFELMLNPETGSYVYRILAYKTLLMNPAHFGIKKGKLRYASKIPYKVYRVDTTITDLAQFARAQGVNLVTLRIFNPWLLRSSLPNAAGKTYEIRVPKDQEADYTAYIRDLVPEGDVLLPYVTQTQKVVIPQTIEADTLLSKEIKYVVRVDEPIANLAAFFKVNHSDLCKWNNLEPTATAVRGQTLVIHVPR